jgi:hypothetical protein
MKASSPKHVHDNNQTYFADFLSRLHDPMHQEKRGGDKRSENDDPDRCEGGHAPVVAWRGRMARMR